MCGAFDFITRIALKGSLQVGEEPTAHEAFHTLVLSGDENEGGVKLTALADDTEAVVVCALPQTAMVFQ